MTIYANSSITEAENVYAQLNGSLHEAKAVRVMHNGELHDVFTNVVVIDNFQDGSLSEWHGSGGFDIVTTGKFNDSHSLRNHTEYHGLSIEADIEPNRVYRCFVRPEGDATTTPYWMVGSHDTGDQVADTGIAVNVDQDAGYFRVQERGGAGTIDAVELNGVWDHYNNYIWELELVSSYQVQGRMFTFGGTLLCETDVVSHNTNYGNYTGYLKDGPGDMFYDQLEWEAK